MDLISSIDEKEELSNEELAKRIQSLLSSSAPFVDTNCITILNQLLQTTSINTATVSCSDLWTSLDSLQPLPFSSNLVIQEQPFQLDVFLTTALSSTTQPIPNEIKEMYKQLLLASSIYSSNSNSIDVQSRNEELSVFSNRNNSRGGIQIIDDGSICLSCSISPTCAEDVTLTPHSIVLSPTSKPSSQSTGGINSNSWWDLGWNSNSRGNNKTVMIAKKVWRPEVDKISVQCSWWGYQIYIPHTIMLNLDKKVDPYLAALQTISDVLNFIVNHIPPALDLLPPIALLKTILPIISTIAGFFIWYWKRVEANDKDSLGGNGVILAATWILPIGLVPREWKTDLVVPKGVAREVGVEKEGGEREAVGSREEREELVSRELSFAMNDDSEGKTTSVDPVKSKLVEEADKDLSLDTNDRSLFLVPLPTSPTSTTSTSTSSIRSIEKSRFTEELSAFPSLPSSTSSNSTSTLTSSQIDANVEENGAVICGREGEGDVGNDLMNRAEKLSGLFSFVKRKK